MCSVIVKMSTDSWTVRVQTGKKLILPAIVSFEIDWPIKAISGPSLLSVQMPLELP